jgi:hypothetical protein
MPSRAVIGLTVITLCAGAAAAEQPGPFSTDEVRIGAAEPNGLAPDPNQPWDPAQHLTATWEYVYAEMSSGIYNPALMPSMQPTGPQYYLSLSIRMNVVDSNGLIGLSYSPVSAQAFNRNGQAVCSMPADPTLSRYYQPVRPTSVLVTGPDGIMTVTTMLASHVYVSMPLDPGARLPSVLDKVVWSTNLLLAREQRTIDVPFAVSDTWIELAPGLEVLVEKAFAEDQEYEFSVRARWRSAQADYSSRGSIFLYRDAKPADAIVLSMDVLDDQGKPIPGGTSSGNYSNVQGVMIGNNIGNGHGPACGKAKTIRYTLALGAYEKATQFAVDNVPVPVYR